MDVVFQKDKQKKSTLSGKFKNLKNKVKSFKFSNTFYYFCILLLIGFGFYLFMLIENGFSLAYGGDYSAQYIPMGYHVWDYYHEWIKTGHFTLFDSTLYLGANSIGSNTYYGLFSPFNIIIVALPREIIPQSIAICSIVKLACAGLFFHFYMSHSFGVKENIARICGIAYAFCGWGAFYLWYNNYQDILVFFPLVLWGVEKVIKEQKPWLLAVGVFLLSICNYVLMVSYIICAFLYAMFRFFQQIRKQTVKDNFIILGLGFLGFATGLLMALFIVFPALMTTLSSPKLDGLSYGGMLKQYLQNHQFKEFFELLFSWEKAPDQHNRIFKTRIYYPILEFFFPPTTCRSLPTLELNRWDFDDMAVSLWCYVPFILFLVPALIQSVKEKKWSHLIGFALLVLTLFTPFMYFLTMAFSNGYARWTLFIVTSLLAYVGIYMDKIPNVAKWHIHVGYTFALLGIIAAWVITWKIYVPDATKSGELIHRFVEDKYDFTNIAFIIEIAYVTIVYLVMFFLYNKKFFYFVVTVFISAEAIAVGNFVTLGHGYDTSYNNGYYENEQFRKALVKIDKVDHSYYRVYSYLDDGWSVNNGFLNNYNTVGFFHSVYNFEINDFTLWTGLRNGTSSVSGDYRGKYQDLDNLLGVKYYFISKDKSKYDLIEKNNPNGYIANVPYDFDRNTDYETPDSDFLVYENRDLNGFGYSFDSIYGGSLPDDTDDVRFDIESIKNVISLASVGVVNEEDAQEIATNYPEITNYEERPEVHSIRQYRQGADYLSTYYYFDQAAKRYPFENIPSIPDTFTPVLYSVDEDNDKHAMNYYMFLKNTADGEPLFKEGTTLYVRAPFSPSKKYNFYFLDKDGHIFMFDMHDDDTTDNVNYIRGFYITKDVYSLAVCGKYYESFLYSSTVKFYTETKDAYDARKNILNANPVENITYQKDKFTFDTNYEDRARFVISRVAYDKGWSIKAQDKHTGQSFDVKVYKGNGGFVSFAAPKGNYTYTMTYQTPYLSVSSIVSAFSITGFFVSMVGYHIYVEKKKTKYADNINRDN